MEKLFQPFEARGLRFKNRIVHEPTTMNLSDPHGHVTDRLVGVYETLAKGGFGAVIVGATCVRHDGLINERMLGIYDDTYVIGLRDVVEVIHHNDSLAGIQLFYGGLIPGLGATVPLKPGEGWIPDTVSWGPSDVLPIGNPKPRVVPTEVYQSLVEDFGQAARRVQEAGFDFVSFHFCHGSLPHTTLSLLSNVGRRDPYADRFLFCEQIIERTQELCGEGFPIVPRLCCDENLEGGYDIEYFAEHYAPRLHRLGIAVLDCTFGSMLPAKSRRTDVASFEFIGGGFYTPNVVNLDNIRLLKRRLRERGIDMPLIGSCNLGTPDHLRTMVEEGGAEFAGVCRLSIDDPEFPNKMREGREREIRKSARTGASLLQGNIFAKGWCGSAQNPDFGRDREYRIRPTTRPKKVVIAGGGPGGMEYARLARMIGHEVVLFERSRRLGGAMDWAGNYRCLPNVESMRHQPDYQIHQLELLGVDRRLGIEATAELILAEKPDVVVVATGSRAVLPQVPGLRDGCKRGFVLTLDEVMARDGAAADPGRSVVLWGAGEGIELAIDLARQGRSVRLLDPGAALAPAVYIGSRAHHVLPWLAQAGVHPELGVVVEQVGEKSVRVKRPDGAGETIACDALIVSLGRESVNGLATALAGRGPTVHVIGDARQPRSFGNAVHEAAYLVRQI
ncbi:MAG: FAD-dependent oxidoreductase [Deltaproteobacteria bacterium]|nr:FAD-dependent oxidoreductase [Deltaproteobacteria bacterium]